jgi:hypothetical protein
MNEILKLQQELTRHPIYQRLDSLENIRCFMETHVFAVWDFMSLLKSLQRRLTCVDLPWRPSGRPADVVRLINQIVVGEESDLDQAGQAISHFELYLQAMHEAGASVTKIHDFLSTLDLASIPLTARDFVTHNLQVAQQGHDVEVAANFFFGREKLIPAMFQTIVDTLKREKVAAPTLLYYLERHIEVDGEEHGPLALKCLESLIGNDPKLSALAQAAGVRSLEMRRELWDRTLIEMDRGK